MEVTHKIVFSVFGIGIRDTVVMTWIMMALISALVLILRRRMPAMIDWIFKMINGMVGGILEGDEISSYLPLLGSLFIFILCANLLSVIPGLTSPTADVNTTFVEGPSDLSHLFPSITGTPIDAAFSCRDLSATIRFTCACSKIGRAHV